MLLGRRRAGRGPRGCAGAGWRSAVPDRRPAFVGNSAVLPPGAVLGDGVCDPATLSIPPEGLRGPVPDGTTPVRLACDPVFRARASRGIFGAATYRPPATIVAERLFVDFSASSCLRPCSSFSPRLIMNATDVLQDYIKSGNGFAFAAAALCRRRSLLGARDGGAEAAPDRPLPRRGKTVLVRLRLAFGARRRAFTRTWPCCFSWTCCAGRIVPPLGPSDCSASRSAGDATSTPRGSRSST